MRTRVAVGLAGALAVVYGTWTLLDLGWDNLVATTVWLAAGVILHDAVLSPLVVLVLSGSAAVVRPAVRRPLVAAAVVIGTVTLSAVPVLGRFGARPDNPTLLPRDYPLGWLVLAACVLGLSGLSALRAWRRR